MVREAVLSTLIEMITADGSDGALRAIADAGGHADQAVMLIDGEFTVAEALSYAEGLLAMGAWDPAREVISEAVRAAFGGLVDLAA